MREKGRAGRVALKSREGQTALLRQSQALSEGGPKATTALRCSRAQSRVGAMPIRASEVATTLCGGRLEAPIRPRIRERGLLSSLLPRGTAPPCGR